MDTWRAMIRERGGRPRRHTADSTLTHTVTAEADGYLSEMDGLSVGVASWRRAPDEQSRTIGTGRCGYRNHAKPGDQVKAGQPLHLHTGDEWRIPALLRHWTGSGDQRLHPLLVTTFWTAWAKT